MPEPAIAADHRDMNTATKVLLAAIAFFFARLLFVYRPDFIESLFKAVSK